jgi:phage-related protein
LAGKPVEREFGKLKASLQGALIELLGTVKRGGPQSLEAHEAKPLKGKIWEFRVSAEDGIARALYVSISGQTVVVLHIFEKKSQKTPPQAIKLAEKRLREYVE